MTDTTTIPPEAAEALSDAVADLIGERLSLYEARAACLAMLNAWPDVEHSKWGDGEQFIILPLTESSDGK
jgi:hypothetical protein